MRDKVRAKIEARSRVHSHRAREHSRIREYARDVRSSRVVIELDNRVLQLYEIFVDVIETTLLKTPRNETVTERLASSSSFLSSCHPNGEAPSLVQDHSRRRDKPLSRSFSSQPRSKPLERDDRGLPSPPPPSYPAPLVSSRLVSKLARECLLGIWSLNGESAIRLLRFYDTPV